MPQLSLSTPRIALALLTLGLSLASGVALADDAGFGPGNGGGRGQARRNESRALADAVRRVERATGGEVLSAERVPFDGRDVSRVKVVDTSGRVRIYMDDPQGPRAPERAPRTRHDDGDSD